MHASSLCSYFEGAMTGTFPSSIVENVEMAGPCAVCDMRYTPTNAIARGIASDMP